MSPSSQNRSTNGRFKKGVSGNQAGRPPGSRNQASLAVEQILQGEAELLTRKAIELAAQGNMSALRLCMERILPVRKERSIELEFRPMQNANDLPVNFRDIPTAVAEGRITPSEGESLPTILGSHARALELVELDRRVQTVESHVQALESQTQTWNRKPKHWNRSEFLAGSDPASMSLQQFDFCLRLHESNRAARPP